MPAPPRPVVAAFDFDGTLTRRDCVVPFLRHVAGTAGLAVALGRHSRGLVGALVHRDRDRLKAVASRAVFRGLPFVEVEDAAVAFADRVRSSWLRDDVVGALDEHRRRGDRVVVVSASYGVYLRPVADHLGVNEVIATELVVGGDGRCTGALDGGNCRGATKVTRLHRWLDQRCGGRRAVTLWAYGDSRGDAPMLDDADQAVWVGSAGVGHSTVKR